VELVCACVTVGLYVSAESGACALQLQLACNIYLEHYMTVPAAAATATAAGHELCREGDEADCLWLLQEGELLCIRGSKQVRCVSAITSRLSAAKVAHKAVKG
jgi:hypothetical protein